MHAFTFNTALAGLFALSMTAPDGLPAALVVNPDNTVPPPPNAFKVGGVATFNNYINQGSSVCYPSPDGSKVITADETQQAPFGAAAGDLSPDIGRGVAGGQVCSGTQTSLSAQNPESYNVPGQPPRCAGQTPSSSSDLPSCPQVNKNCPATSPMKGQDTCYQVTSWGYATPGQTQPFRSGTTTVRIIDSCPAGSPQNFCKTNVTNLFEKCQDPRVNALDIDQAAYQALTGEVYVDGKPNVGIYIAAIDCTAAVGTAATQ